MLTTLDEIIMALEMTADVAGMYPPAAAPAALSAKLLAIADAAIKAHVAATGKPFDPALLAPVAPA
jgi:purine nucleoside phosphorylase